MSFLVRVANVLRSSSSRATKHALPEDSENKPRSNQADLSETLLIQRVGKPNLYECCTSFETPQGTRPKDIWATLTAPSVRSLRSRLHHVP